MDWRGIGSLIQQLGGTDQALSAIMDARGENPNGTVNPLLQNKSISDLALIDRYSNAQAAKQQYGTPLALAGITLGAVPYEAAKGLMQATGTGKLMSSIGGFFGHPDYGIDQSTSPASMQNIAAYYHGLFD